MVWSDDETLLLLNVTNEYKNAMTAEGIDYDTVKSKYKEVQIHHYWLHQKQAMFLGFVSFEDILS